MSFDRYIGKERRKPYHGSKRYDHTCRNHGSCPVCQQNRKYAATKQEQAAKAKVKDYDLNNR